MQGRAGSAYYSGGQALRRCLQRSHRELGVRPPHKRSGGAIARDRRRGASALVVDIAGNGGGTEWSEAVARMLTPIRLRSEELRFVRGDHWARAFGGDEQKLRKFEAGATGDDRKLLHTLADDVEARRRDALTSCDATPLWRGAQLSCSWLGEGFYGSGLLAAADPATLRGKPWATLLFSPMEFPYEEGVWRKPLIVLIDGNVGSAASEFAAVLQDNRAALIMGARPAAAAGTPMARRRR